MNTKGQLRTRLRDELGDNGASQVWSDTLLDSLLDEAVDWYSRLFPMQAVAYRDVAAGQTTFAVPPGALQIVQAECPPGTVLPQEASAPAGESSRGGLRQSWSIWAGAVFLGNPASGNEVGTGRLIIKLLLPWDPLSAIDDWNGPPGDERLLVIWAAGEAWAWLDGQDQKRGRPGKAGIMARRYAGEIEGEIRARGRAASSRRLDSD